MHALPSHPKHPVLLAALALLLALLLLAASAPDLATLDFSTGRDAASADAGAQSIAAPAGAPVWITEPFAPPVTELAAAR